MTSVGHIDVGRIYDARPPSGGYRVLVDRVWPRGLTKATADLDEWCRDVAPTTELRRWYGHRPERLAEFRERYLVELDDADHAEAVAHLRTIARHDRIWLLTATKDLALSHARVLAERMSWGQASSGPTLYHVHLNQP
ncbi:MAG TPA: DUF488 family protein [Jatrophihabitans sp.]|jgi:uncharacterized protein YeaO (DUF488 family)|uniref:DUF488 domain-containing protein n=1 Tax=Jatrophihabitans sp. TaxID=1932789 RepID=UPI002DFBA527|nr:DUF488 family protein [Jatrophihabitans sp.]